MEATRWGWMILIYEGIREPRRDLLYLPPHSYGHSGQLLFCFPPSPPLPANNHAGHGACHGARTRRTVPLSGRVV